jgi:hypothetical protein
LQARRSRFVVCCPKNDVFRCLFLFNFFLFLGFPLSNRVLRFLKFGCLSSVFFFFFWYTFFSFFKYITYNKSLWIWCNLLFVIIAQVIIQDLIRVSGLTVCNLCNDKLAPTLLMHDIFEHLQKKVL